MRSPKSKNEFLSTLDGTTIEYLLQSCGTEDDIENLSEDVLAKIDENCPAEPCQALRRDAENTLAEIEKKSAAMEKASEKRRDETVKYMKKMADAATSLQGIPDLIRDATMDPEKLESQCHANIDYIRSKGLISDEQATRMRKEVSQKLDSSQGISGLQSSFKDVSAGLKKGKLIDS